MLRDKAEGRVPTYHYLGVLPEVAGGTNRTTGVSFRERANALSKSQKGQVNQAVPLDASNKTPIEINIDLEYPSLKGERIMTQSVDHTMVITNYDGDSGYTVTTNDDLIISREQNTLTIRTETIGIKTFKINSRTITLYVVAANTALKPKIIYPEHGYDAMVDGMQIHIESKGQANQAYAVISTKLTIETSTDINFSKVKTNKYEIIRVNYDYGKVFKVPLYGLNADTLYYVRVRAEVTTVELGTSLSLHSEIVSLRTKPLFRTMVNNAIIKRANNTLFTAGQSVGMGLDISGNGKIIAVVRRPSLGSTEVVVDFYSNESGLFIHRKTISYATHPQFAATNVEAANVFLNYQGDKAVVLLDRGLSTYSHCLITDDNLDYNYAVKVYSGALGKLDIDSCYANDDLTSIFISTDPNTSTHYYRRLHVPLESKSVLTRTTNDNSALVYSSIQSASFRKIVVKSKDVDYRSLFVCNGDDLNTLQIHITDTKDKSNDGISFSLAPYTVKVDHLTNMWHNGVQTIMAALMNHDNSKIYLITRVNTPTNGLQKGYGVYVFNIDSIYTSSVIEATNESFYIESDLQPTTSACLSPDSQTLYLGVTDYVNSPATSAVHVLVNKTLSNVLTNIGNIPNTSFGNKIVVDKANNCLAISDLGNNTTIGQIYLFG